MNNGKHHGCCEHSHGCSGGGCCKSKSDGITIDKYELAVLKELLEYNYLPISRFIMCSSHTDEARFTALAPVYIDDKADSMEMVKSFARRLDIMAEKKLISLDYGSALQGYDYEQHKNSDLFHYFESTVKEGAEKPGHLCDTAEIECGSVSMTPFGLTAAQRYFEFEE